MAKDNQTSDIVEDVSNLGAAAKKQASKVVASSREAIQQGIETTRDTATGLYKDIISYVKDKPVSSMLIALAVGSLVAICCGRKSD